MFRPFLSLLLFAPALFLVPRLAAQQPSLNSSSCPCILRGTVIDSVSGNPVRGAFVQASTGSGWSAFTDAEGKFQFDAVPAGPITVHAAKPGYLSEDDFGRPFSSSLPKASFLDKSLMKTASHSKV